MVKAVGWCWGVYSVLEWCVVKELELCVVQGIVLPWGEGVGVVCGAR